ncbi:hypothetical protein L1987_55155 [Smallanthus sonchifolius]|uniref:Uncharacterized protein n=1 Tax=Smallanthus sonchifolius TaxID=185202 RepID=A0ACB9E9T1_9ASTR|nr:hypothetical protein L1987_55155 [Smallanthus sonchifolius]
MKIEHLEHLYNEDLSHIMDDDMVRLSLLVLVEVGMKGTQKNSYMDNLLPSFRPKEVNPNEVEVDEEWWVESITFIEQQERESIRRSVRGKGHLNFEPHYEEVKPFKKNEDSEKLDKILLMMQQILLSEKLDKIMLMMQQLLGSKRKWSSVEVDPTGETDDPT